MLMAQAQEVAQLAIQARDAAAAARKMQEAVATEAEAAASVQRKVTDELAAVEARAADPASEAALAAATAVDASPTGAPPMRIARSRGCDYDLQQKRFIALSGVRRLDQ